jgi:hypothetical protein
MKTLIKILLFGAFVAGLTSVAIATDNNVAHSNVTITFSEISVLAVSGDPALITIEAPAAAGSLPADKTNAFTTMAWTSNVDGTTRKITGKLDAVFPGVDLYAAVADPGADYHGTTAGKVKLTATDDSEFVTGIGSCNVSGKTITFTTTVTSMVPPYTETEQVVTWTLTDVS